MRSQGREVEALQVTELLKIQELNEFARGEDKKPQIPLSTAELETQKLQGTLIAFGQRVAECEQKKCSQLSQLRTERDNLNREFFQKIKEIEKAYDGKDPNLIYPGNFLNAAKAIVEAQPNTVLIYPLVLEDKISILWASRGVVVKSVEVKGVTQKQLGETVFRFRELLENKDSDITELQTTGKQLYDWLIKPIEGELKKNKIENLVFALDRSTRYIPMSALFDGKQYLVENYNVSTVISAGLTNMSDRLPSGTQNTPVLALGLSDAVAGFNPLPAVEQELDAIIKSNTTDAQGIYPGLKFLNQAFDWLALRDNVTEKKILHIATHGAFVPNDPAASYLLSGTGKKIPITEIQLLQNLNNLHLVVLSACETARGGANQNGVEISGISSYFIGNNRAKAVMASLWLVNDASTALLMQKFYSNLAQDTPLTKSQALRQAQLNMLKGNTTTNANRQRNIVVEARPNAPNQRRRSSSQFSHPYYWAPFILIGNGL
ncbi:MAG: CHAT domain-containing protein [Nostocaceae cyanobacterium]|nr:CHAT domain-containing protein [Nostocaceae cyanobacterium]